MEGGSAFTLEERFIGLHLRGGNNAKSVDIFSEWLLNMKIGGYSTISVNGSLKYWLFVLLFI